MLRWLQSWWWWPGTTDIPVELPYKPPLCISTLVLSPYATVTILDAFSTSVIQLSPYAEVIETRCLLK